MFQGIYGNADDFKWYHSINKNPIQATKIPILYHVLAAYLHPLINQFFDYWFFIIFSHIWKYLKIHQSNITTKY